MYKDIQVHRMHIVLNKYFTPVYRHTNAYIDNRGRVCVTKTKYRCNNPIGREVSYPIKKSIKDRISLERTVVTEKTIKK